MSLPIDISGRVFGVITAVRRVPNIRKSVTRWEFVCECGKVVHADYVNVVHGTTKSCGCVKNKKAGDRTRTHGMSETKVYKAWQQMRLRCRPNSADAKHYFDKGIHVADEWSRSFEAFYAYIGDPPTPKHTIDRIDTSKGYCHGNVRWATWTEQQNNRSNNVNIVTPLGELTVTQALRKYGVNRTTYYKRLRRGLSDLEALGIL